MGFRTATTAHLMWRMQPHSAQRRTALRNARSFPLSRSRQSRGWRIMGICVRGRTMPCQIMHHILLRPPWVITSMAGCSRLGSRAQASRNSPALRYLVTCRDYLPLICLATKSTRPRRRVGKRARRLQAILLRKLTHIMQRSTIRRKTVPLTSSSASPNAQPTPRATKAKLPLQNSTGTTNAAAKCPTNTSPHPRPQTSKWTTYPNCHPFYQPPAGRNAIAQKPDRQWVTKMPQS
ncbi:hypothetical protein PENSPDRAFT_189011 [Peniophora sp. CONT]|nr:hypothetical protein PENSPDRAFT_189011 [Peniophora sp. CONT]